MNKTKESRKNSLANQNRTFDYKSNSLEIKRSSLDAKKDLQLRSHTSENKSINPKMPSIEKNYKRMQTMPGPGSYHLETMFNVR